MSKKKFITQYFCVCNQSYSQKRQLRKHISHCKYAQNPGKKYLMQSPISRCRITYVNGDQNTSNIQSTQRYKCGCEKSFLSKGGYYRHIKKCQLRPEQQVATGKTKCNEPGCLLTFKYIRDFRQHLNEKHQIQFDVEDKMFDKYSDFLNWKVNYESETRSCFYHRKTLTSIRRRVEYWYCNRSGNYQSALQNRRRKLKSQGILKINNNCTSSIILTVNEIEDTIQAVIHHTHYGHEAELEHLPISKSDKQEIVSKLKQGVNIEDILSSYKEDQLSKQTERKHLIKRRDILNISKKYNSAMLPKVNKKSKGKIKHKLVQEPPIINFLSNMTEVNERHCISSQLALSFVSQIQENVWRISMEVSTYTSNNYDQEVYVTKNDVVSCSINDCNSYCTYCHICYHAYSCTCSDFLSKRIICEHVHLTVTFQVNQGSYQNEDHRDMCLYGNQDHTKYTRNYAESTNSHFIKNFKLCDLTKNNDIYKPNKKTENLCIKTRLKKLMMKTLRKIDKCNNKNLLEILEGQITYIDCNLDNDLLENATKEKNEVQTMLPKKSIEVYYVI